MDNARSSYHDALLESLTDPIEAKHYLNAVLEDYPEGFLKALRNVAQAHQMSKVAEDAGIKRESLYRALSESGNPTLDTFTSILAAVNLKMSIDTLTGEQIQSPVLYTDLTANSVIASPTLPDPVRGIESGGL